VLSPDGKWGIWPFGGGGLRPIPGLDASYHVSGWSSDGRSLLVVPARQREKTGNVYQVNITTGKIDLVKTFGDGLPAGTVGMGGSYLPANDGAYAYLYMQTLSQVYVVRGMK
jgi:hypothetical protein